VPNAGSSHLLRTSRPRFWIYLLGPWLLGAFAGAADARDFLDWKFWIGCLGFAFPANLFVYGVNDIHDTETDERNAKKTDDAAGYERFLPRSEHRRMTAHILAWNIPWTFALLVSSAFRSNWPGTGALLAFLFFSYGYSAPPIRAKARPIVDSIFNILYACPGFAAFFLMGGRWDSGTGLVLAAAWLWCMAMHAFSAVPDIDADREAGVETVATRLGRERTLLACGISYVLAAGFAGAALHDWWIALVALAAMGFAYAVLVGVALSKRAGDRVFAVYRIFPAVNATVGFLLTMLVLLHRWPVLRP
jgi:4-hydroxybenzoate polyprenyltransferase